jgi:hypothetical protein
MEARKKRLFAFVVLSALWAAGCATVANTHTARPVSADGVPSASSQTPSGLTISGEELEEVSSPHFGVLAVTFENPTNEWIRIDGINLDFGSDTKNQFIFVPWGEQIVSWELATSQRLAIRHANTENTLSLLAIGGAIASGLGNRSAVGAMGGLVVLGSVGALWGKAMVDKTTAATFPPAHLFATPFSVPPGLFAKKWVLLNGPESPAAGCIRSVNIDYDVAGKGRERVLLQFGRGGSDWQKTACRGAG